MNTTGTTTTIARGCEWCETCLYSDGWDSDSPADQVVPLFHEACEELGRGDIYWTPTTSEVNGLCHQTRRSDGTLHSAAHIDGGEPDIDLDALRDAVSTAVYDAAIKDRVADLADVGDLQRFVM